MHHQDPSKSHPPTHLPVPVAECDGDHEPLCAVQHDVEVLVEGLPDAVRARLHPVDHGQPVEPEEGKQHHRGTDGLPAKEGRRGG